jgi:hypothetical protein
MVALTGLDGAPPVAVKVAEPLLSSVTLAGTLTKVLLELSVTVALGVGLHTVTPPVAGLSYLTKSESKPNVSVLVVSTWNETGKAATPK